MRIAINTRLWIEGKMDGIGWFTAETSRRMVKNHPEHEFFLFFDRKPSSDLELPVNTHCIVLNPPARHPILWYLFFEWSVRRAMKRYNIDLFLSPDGWVSIHSDVPTLAVIHDINFEHSKGNLKPSHQIYMSHYFHRFAQRAERIATVSEFSKSDICTTYQIPDSKIDVVYNGSQTLYKPASPLEQESTRKKFAKGRPYFIFVSTIIRRKNLTNLLLAFDKFKQNDPNETQLVVAGAPVWWQDELKEAYDNMAYRNDVILMGRVDSQDLADLVSGATGMVYPSFYEGFGIPILEAFYAETPVIASNVTSIPEVAGDAAILIDPYNVDQIADAIKRVSEDRQLRMNMVDRGRVQREKFSWDITTNRLWNSLMHLSNKK